MSHTHVRLASEFDFGLHAEDITPQKYRKVGSQLIAICVASYCCILLGVNTRQEETAAGALQREEILTAKIYYECDPRKIQFTCRHRPEEKLKKWDIGFPEDYDQFDNIDTLKFDLILV